MTPTEDVFCMSCPVCGGTLIGDGYRDVIRCEDIDSDLIWEAEPDRSPIYCVRQLAALDGDFP